MANPPASSSNASAMAPAAGRAGTGGGGSPIVIVDRARRRGVPQRRVRRARQHPRSTRPAPPGNLRCRRAKKWVRSKLAHGPLGTMRQLTQCVHIGLARGYAPRPPPRDTAAPRRSRATVARGFIGPEHVASGRGGAVRWPARSQSCRCYHSPLRVVVGWQLPFLGGH